MLGGQNTSQRIQQELIDTTNDYDLGEVINYFR